MLFLEAGMVWTKGLATYIITYALQQSVVDREAVKNKVKDDFAKLTPQLL